MLLPKKFGSKLTILAISVTMLFFCLTKSHSYQLNRCIEPKISEYNKSLSKELNKTNKLRKSLPLPSGQLLEAQTMGGVFARNLIVDNCIQQTKWVRQLGNNGTGFGMILLVSGVITMFLLKESIFYNLVNHGSDNIQIAGISESNIDVNRKVTNSIESNESKTQVDKSKFTINLSSINTLNDFEEMIQKSLHRLYQNGISQKDAKNQIANDIIDQTSKSSDVLAKLINWSKSFINQAETITINKITKDILDIALAKLGISINS